MISPKTESDTFRFFFVVEYHIVYDIFTIGRFPFKICASTNLVTIELLQNRRTLFLQFREIYKTITSEENTSSFKEMTAIVFDPVWSLIYLQAAFVFGMY